MRSCSCYGSRMNKISRLAAAGLLASVCVFHVHAASAHAADACGSMLMPAVQLKQVGRGLSSYHPGIDLMAPYGSPIRAAAAGRVVYAGWYSGYGKMVDIEQDDGVITRYAHLSSFANTTRPGRVVAVGETLGAVGTSGHAHGAHLHFEVRINGRPVDPKIYLSLSSCTPSRTDPVEEAQAPNSASGYTATLIPAGSSH